MRHVSLADLAANATELDAALEAGEVTLTVNGRDYRLVAAAPALTPERQAAMDDAAAFRQRLRDRGVRVTRDEVREWINEGQP